MIFRFEDPQFLLLLFLIPLLIWWYIKYRDRTTASLRFSHLGFARKTNRSGPARARHFLFGLRMLVLALLITAFAKPQSGITGEEVITQGIDIVLALDISSSMLAEDIKPNRVEAVKRDAENFIKGRKNDRIGMVIFSGDAFTQCPLTLDYGILLNFLDKIKVGMIEDGTAIGMGLATAVNRMRNSKAKSKVIVLLTDGRNNKGEVDPITAAQLARTFDIKIYAIGAGGHGSALYPVDDPVFGKRYVPMKIDIDEKTLKEVSNMTGGEYFRADDRQRLQEIFKKIDDMEKTKIEVKEYTRYSELFYYFVLAALLLLIGEIVLAHTKFRKIP
ncbi:MAG: VWA domain-containing protein [bacterium]